jgi:hypothetical protein
MATAAAAALLGTLINSINADVMNFRFAWVVLGLVRGLPRRSIGAMSGLREGGH